MIDIQVVKNDEIIFESDVQITRIFSKSYQYVEILRGEWNKKNNKGFNPNTNNQYYQM